MYKIVRALFVCSYCKHPSFSSQDCLQHEKECIHNPSNKYCQTCRYYDNYYCEKHQVRVVSVWCVSGRGAEEQSGNTNLDWETRGVNNRRV